MRANTWPSWAKNSLKVLFLALVFLFLVSPTWASLKVGVVLPLSGEKKALGKALRLWLEEVNLYLAGDGQPLRLIFFDSRGKCKRLNRIVEEAFLKGVQVLIGPAEAACAGRLVKEVQRLGLPAIVTAGDFHPVKELGKPFGPYFRTGLSSRAAVKVLYRCLKKKGYHRVGLLLTKDDFGREGERWLLAYATEYALKIVGKRYFSRHDTDVSVHLEGLLEAEAIVCWAPKEAAARVARNAFANHFGIPIFFPHVVADEPFLRENAGLYGRPFVGAAFLSGEGFSGFPGLKDLFERLRLEGFLFRAPIFASYADALIFLRVGLKRGGARGFVRGLERAGLVKGLTGLYFLSRDDHYGLLPASVGVFRYRGGQYEPLCPPSPNIF